MQLIAKKRIVLPGFILVQENAIIRLQYIYHFFFFDQY